MSIILERLQQTRRECLLQLYGAQTMAITPAFIRRRLRAEIPDLRDISEQEVANALFFLHGMSLCQELRDQATGELRYRITAAGILHYERAES